MTATMPQKSDTGLRSASHWHAALLAVVFGALVSLLRVFLARPLQFCGTPDACYYLGLGQELSSGHGFHARFLYDFQQAHLAVPNTGIEYWRPGISLLLASLKPLGGPTLFSSVVLTILAGLVLAASAWFLAMRLTQSRGLALASFALCLVTNPLWVGSASPDSALYYGAATAWFLALFTVDSQGWVADLLALLCVACAYLIRNDAALLFVPFLAVLWYRRRVRTRLTPADAARFSAVHAPLLVLGFFLALAPMHLLYRAVLGSAFPSGTSSAFFLNDLGDFVRYGAPVSLHTLLATGVAHLLTLRLVTLATVLYRAAVLMIGYPALVFLATWLAPTGRLGSSSAPSPGALLRDNVGPLTFGAVILLAYTLVLPVVGQFSALRSFVGLMPFFSVGTVLAIQRVSRNEQAFRWLSIGVIASNTLAGFAQVRRDIAGANLIGIADRTQAAALQQLGADPTRSIVLTPDPVQFSVTTGYATVALPINGLPAILAAAHDLHASYILFDSDSLPATRAAVQQALHPVRSYDLPETHSWILQLPPAPPPPLHVP